MSTFVTPLTLGQVFKTSFKLYKAAFWKTLPIAILALIVGILVKQTFHYQHHSEKIISHSLSQTVSHSASQTTSETTTQTISQTASMTQVHANVFWSAHWGMHWAVCLIALLINYFLIGALLISYQQAQQNGHVSLGKSYLNAVMRVPVLIAAGVISFILMAIGGIFAFHPGLILGVYLLMVVPLVFLDKKGILGSIKTSLTFVHHNFWRMVFITIVISIVTGICSLWQFPELNMLIRVIFGVLYLAGFAWSVALTYSFYLYLKERVNQPLRQQLYALLRNRPKTVKTAAWCTFIYVVISFAGSIYMLLSSQALDDQSFYALLDAALATNLLLSLSVVFMCFAYIGSNAARITLMVISAIMAILFATHLGLAISDYQDITPAAITIMTDLATPALGLILNIVIIVLLIQSKAWYKTIRAFKMDQDLDALRAEIHNTSA